MSVKIRFARIGRHQDAFFRIVVADSRYSKDGRYIEQIGYYDPEKNAEEATINEELALKWLNCGAIPSDTVRALLNRKGIMEKYNVSKKKGK